ncbi:MAG: excinuclease ABC subunit UvrC [Pseudomonadota bacterium]
MSRQATSLHHGIRIISEYLKTLPSSPGVYRMISNAEEVLYVGKAKNLKKRVQSYTRGTGHSNRIARMIAETTEMEFVTTATESEALLLEANLIKQLKPRYNVLYRDDKSFPYILIAHDHDAPQILKHRGRQKRKGRYFGPFASAGAVNSTINTLQRAFLLRTCSDTVYKSRTRPCLLYQIKRCSGPCTGEISISEYQDYVTQAQDFLRGNSSSVRRDLQRLMEEAAEKLEYEEAAKHRNRLWALAHVQANQDINPDGIEDANVFAAHREADQICIQVFFFRIGQNWGNHAYFPKADQSLSLEDILESFIAQFYNDKPVPKLILLSHELPQQILLAEALSSKSDQKVSINAPERGQKKELVKHALKNAQDALGRKLSESATQRKLLETLTKVFLLDEAPKRIEVYDNSHIQGAHAVGAMVVAGVDGFEKNQYRKFNIKSTDITPGDDFGMMREVLTRRFSRLIKEHGTYDAQNDTQNTASNTLASSMPPWPDLVLIDGGKGQLSAACEVLDDLGISGLIVVGIAKGPDRDAGREHFHLPGQPAFMLEARDPALYFIQRLRDEAHRFAIGSHRARRKKAISANPLDEIDGIGPARKRALLHHFGSAKAVARAGVPDLQTVEGISQNMAQTIYDFFHEANS